MNRKQWTTENGVWEIIEHVSNTSHRRGWLINNNSGNRYVWSTVGTDRVRYMKEYKAPTNIPKFLDEVILNGNNQEKDDRGTEKESNQSLPTG